MLNYSATPRKAADGALLDQVFQALADPARRGMVERLSRGPATVSELAQPLAMSLPAVMQHLQVLEQSGLVRSEKTGRVRTCHVEKAALRAVGQWVARRRTSWEQKLDRLETFLADEGEDENEDAPPARKRRSKP
jgi:DNA-binding transcriptional ArsR family regulator